MNNQATALLYREHEAIENALQAVDSIVRPGIDNDSFKQSAQMLIKFFREYGDAFHHQKEEQLLFPAMIARNELIGESVISEMLDNHTDFREMLAKAQTCINADDCETAKQVLKEYTEALRDHIAVENDEVFPMAESLFTEEEASRMGFQFEDIDREIGLERKSELNALVDEIQRHS